MALKILAVLLVFMTVVTAQTVTVVDGSTGRGIPAVAIVSENPRAATTTDSLGRAEISAFHGADRVTFTHVSYQTRVLSHVALERLQIVGLTQKVIALTEVVVSSGLFRDDLRTIPYTADVVRKEQASFANSRTSADLLELAGPVFVQKSQLAGGSPMIRGFAANRVLLVVDGVRMNTAIFRSGNVQNVISLDASAVQNVEVISGPGAVFYGSDAIGGVMDFSTQRPGFSHAGVDLRGEAFVRTSSAEGERSAHGTIIVELPTFGSVTSFTHSRFGDLRAGANGEPSFLRPVYQAGINGVDSQVVNPDPSVQSPSAFSQTAFMQKVRFNPGATWDLEYSFHYSTTTDAPRYDRLTLDANADGLLDYAEWYYGPQTWIMNRLAIGRSGTTFWMDHMRVLAAVQIFEESRHDRRRGSLFRRDQTETVEAVSFQMDIRKAVAEGTLASYGAEFVNNEVGSRAGRIRIDQGAVEPMATRYPDGATWRNIGLYAKLHHSISPRLYVDGGVRLTFHALEAAFDTTQFPLPFTRSEIRGQAVTGGAGMMFMPNGSLRLHAHASSGFRSPNIDDVGKIFESEPGSVVVPNPGLGPEYAYTLEAGVAGVVAERVRVDATIFWTFLDDAHARRPFVFDGRDSIPYDGVLSRVQAVQNAASASVSGVQAGIRLELGDGWVVRSTFSYQRGTEREGDDQPGFPLRHVAPPFGVTTLSYVWGRWHVEGSLRYNAAMRFEDLALSERNDPWSYARDAMGRPHVPGWTVLDLRASVRVGSVVTVQAAAENLTDVLYRPYSSGISAPGRNLMIAIKAAF